MRAKGFTLLEVMLSLAIVSALLVTVIFTLNYHLTLAERQTAVMLTTTLAQQKLAEILRSPSESSGAFAGEYRDLTYRTFVSEAPFPGMVELSVTVTGRGETVTLAELIVKPR
jgi:general secretion pathway protein I